MTKKVAGTPSTLSESRICIVRLLGPSSNVRNAVFFAGPVRVVSHVWTVAAGTAYAFAAAMWFAPGAGDGTGSVAGSGVVVAGLAVPGCSVGAVEAGSVGSGGDEFVLISGVDELALVSDDGDELLPEAGAGDEPYGTASFGGGSIAHAPRRADAPRTNAARRAKTT
jgi:hypothetical protein